MNNFQNLYDDNTNKFEQDQQKIANNVWKTLGVFKFVGQIVDAYVPKLVDLFTAVLGGQTRGPGSRNPKGPGVPNSWRTKNTKRNI